MSKAGAQWQHEKLKSVLEKRCYDQVAEVQGYKYVLNQRDRTIAELEEKLRVVELALKDSNHSVDTSWDSDKKHSGKPSQDID